MAGHRATALRPDGGPSPSARERGGAFVDHRPVVGEQRAPMQFIHARRVDRDEAFVGRRRITVLIERPGGDLDAAAGLVRYARFEVVLVMAVLHLRFQVAVVQQGPRKGHFAARFVSIQRVVPVRVQCGRIEDQRARRVDRRGTTRHYFEGDEILLLTAGYEALPDEVERLGPRPARRAERQRLDVSAPTHTAKTSYGFIRFEGDRVVAGERDARFFLRCPALPRRTSRSAYPTSR